MEWRLKRQTTVGGLLALVALSALTMSILRPVDPPDQAEAIRLARAYLVAHKEFDYPNGYWVRTEWSEKRGSWRVGFHGHKSGPSLLVEVSRGRSCRTNSAGM